MVSAPHGNRGVPSLRIWRVCDSLGAGRLVSLRALLVADGGRSCPLGLRWCLVGRGRAGVLAACLRAWRLGGCRVAYLCVVAPVTRVVVSSLELVGRMVRLVRVGFLLPVVGVVNRWVILVVLKNRGVSAVDWGG